MVYKKTHKILASVIIFFGLLFFMAGLYLLPIGTDIFLYFFVVVLMHGNWLWGDVLANLTAMLMIVAGIVMLHMEGVKPGVKKIKKVKK